MHSILPHDENPVLREKARPVARGDIGTPRLKTLIAEMKKLLSKEEYGVALAAPQVGESLRLFIVAGKAVGKRRSRYAHEESDGMPTIDEVYINPVIVKTSRGKKDKHEGCLSVRGKWGLVPRAEKLTLRYVDEKGFEQERGASGFLAHIFQHEMDHLEGILYTDKATELYDDSDREE